MPLPSFRRVLPRRRGGPAVEGALTVTASALLLLGVFDIGLALFVSQGVHRSADVMASSLASGAGESVARAAGVSAVPGFMQSCIGATMEGWSSIASANFGAPGTPITPGTRAVRLEVSCAWGWLTPATRVVAGPTAIFRAGAGAVLP